MATAKNTHPLGESHNYYSSRATPPPNSAITLAVAHVHASYQRLPALATIIKVAACRLANNNETTSLTWETDNTKLTRQLIVPKNSWFEAEKSQPATAQEQWQPLYQPKIGR